MLEYADLSLMYRRLRNAKFFRVFKLTLALKK